MRLFKRILLALFPEEIVQQQVNPTRMFVSFISSKQFFSVINRKIVENYKLNLFDVSLDPFEVKVGFGDQPAIKVKDVEFYYAYCSAANLNGYRVFSPATVANAVSLVVSLYIHEEFRKKDDVLYFAFLTSVYLLHFIFAAKLKIFPQTEHEQQYNRFVDLFFEFYSLLLRQRFGIVDKSIHQTLKLSLLKNTTVFFLLFHTYKSISGLFAVGRDDAQEFYHWLFYDEFKKSDYHVVINDFLSHKDVMTQSTTFGVTEQKLIDLILPTDVMIGYLYSQEHDIHIVTKELVGRIFEKDILDDLMHSFITSDARLEEFLVYVTHYQHFKSNFLGAVHHFFQSIYTEQKRDQAIEEEIDEFLSAIGDVDEIPSHMEIPESLKQQSRMMEKLMNFYVSYMGGSWIARGDNFAMRLFKRPLISRLLSQYDQAHHKHQESLHYYGGMLYNYSKNVFYYTYAFENIRAGKDKFHLPFKATFKEVYSNMFLLHLFDENLLITLLQDINIKDLKLYVKQKKIILLFKKYFGSSISQLVRSSPNKIVATLYAPIDEFVGAGSILVPALQQNFSDADISRLKDNAYTLHFWLFQEFCQMLTKQKFAFHDSYPATPLIGILAHCKETLLGLMLLIRYCQGQGAKGQDVRLPLLSTLYRGDIVHLTDPLSHICSELVNELVDRYGEILSLWIDLDDNKRFLQLGCDNRVSYITDKNDEMVLHHTLGEDLIWLRGYVKHLNYYNNRFLVPK